MSAERIYDARNQLGFNLNDPKTGLSPEMLDQAKADGCKCPTCGQFVKVYRRALSSTSARQLIHAYRMCGLTKYFHVRNLVLGQSSVGDFSKLSYWGLIEPKPHEKGEEGKRTSGCWKITEKGLRFLTAHSPVQKYILLYNGKFLGFDGEDIYIQQALGNKFDYNELMEGL